MYGFKYTYYLDIEENNHTTDFTDIDKAEKWKLFDFDDKYLYFVTNYGFLLRKDRKTGEREYLFGEFENNEYYVTIKNKRKTIASIVAETFVPKTREMKEWLYLYKNKDPQDPSIDNLIVINLNEKNIGIDEENKRLIKELQPIVPTKTKQERKQRTKKQDYQVNKDGYKKFVCYPRRFEYFFNKDGDCFREETISSSKYRIEPKTKDNAETDELYIKIGKDYYIAAYIIYELFGENPPDNYRIEYIDGDVNNISIENLKAIELPSFGNEKPLGLYKQDLGSKYFNEIEDETIDIYTRKEASEFFEIPLRRLNDTLSEYGQIKVKLPNDNYFRYLREL